MTFSELQKQVQKFDDLKNWHDPSEHVVLHMSEEVGEISQWMLSKKGYKTICDEDADIGQELTDLLYLVFKLANNEDLDLDEEWSKMWTRFEKK